MSNNLYTAALREPMACGHPKACWVSLETMTFTVNAAIPHSAQVPEPYCSACRHEAASLALLVQKVADKARNFYGAGPNGLAELILSLADPSALAAHGEELVKSLFCDKHQDIANATAAGYLNDECPVCTVEEYKKHLRFVLNVMEPHLLCYYRDYPANAVHVCLGCKREWPEDGPEDHAADCQLKAAQDAAK